MTNVYKTKLVRYLAQQPARAECIVKLDTYTADYLYNKLCQALFSEKLNTSVTFAEFFMYTMQKESSAYTLVPTRLQTIQPSVNALCTEHEEIYGKAKSIL